jgi:hypothetical protein
MAIDKIEIEVVQSDLDKYGKLASLTTSEGGTALLKTLASDVVSEMDRLAAHFRTLEETEMRAIGAALHLKLNMYRALKNAPQNVLDAQEALDELLTS